MHNGSVGKGISLPSIVEVDISPLGSDNSLDFIGIDDSGKVSVVEEGSLEEVALLELGRLFEAAEEVVESFEGFLGPDDESAEVSSGGELEEVKSVDVADLDSWDVSGSLDDGLVVAVIDNERADSHDVSAVSGLSLAGSDLSGDFAFFDFLVDTEFVKEGKEILGSLFVESIDD